MKNFVRRGSDVKLISSALLAAGIVLSAVGISSSGVRAAGTLPMYLPDCQGVPVRAPSTITFACADGGIVGTKITWTDWGSYYAHGQGTLSVNDCTPDCADGHFQKYRLSLIAFGKQTCPNGELAYASVKMMYFREETVAPYTIAGRTYTTRYTPMQQRVQSFSCRPM